MSDLEFCTKSTYGKSADYTYANSVPFCSCFVAFYVPGKFVLIRYCKCVCLLGPYQWGGGGGGGGVCVCVLVIAAHLDLAYRHLYMIND